MHTAHVVSADEFGPNGGKTPPKGAGRFCRAIPGRTRRRIQDLKGADGQAWDMALFWRRQAPHTAGNPQWRSCDVRHGFAWEETHRKLLVHLRCTRHSASTITQAAIAASARTISRFMSVKVIERQRARSVPTESGRNVGTIRELAALATGHARHSLAHDLAHPGRRTRRRSNASVSA